LASICSASPTRGMWSRGSRAALTADRQTGGQGVLPVQTPVALFRESRAAIRVRGSAPSERDDRVAPAGEFVGIAEHHLIDRLDDPREEFAIVVEHDEATPNDLRR
jgi:hypothetical protein